MTLCEFKTCKMTLGAFWGRLHQRSIVRPLCHVLAWNHIKWYKKIRKNWLWRFIRMTMMKIDDEDVEPGVVLPSGKVLLRSKWRPWGWKMNCHRHHCYRHQMETLRIKCDCHDDDDEPEACKAAGRAGGPSLQQLWARWQLPDCYHRYHDHRYQLVV